MDLGFDVVDLGPADHPEEGETAPDFERPLVGGEFWEDASLSELVDSGPVVLVFHTMDGAFPSTYIWNEMRDRGWVDATDGDDEGGDSGDGDGDSDGSGDRGYEVVGLSISTPYEHKTFIEDRGVDARLFSDPGNGVAEQYGIAHDLDGMAGVSEPRPAVFVVDGDREIRYAWAAEEWPDFPDYDAVEAAIDAVA